MPSVLLLLLLAQQPAFRSDVTLVHVDAEVRQGAAAVAGLRAEDFRVADGGKPQAIVHFGYEEEPFDVVLLFDGRPQMRPVIQQVVDAASTALSDLRPDDRVAVMNVGGVDGHCETDVISDFSAGRGSVERAIGKQALPSEPYPNNLNCGVHAGLEGAAQFFQLQPDKNRRRAIIVITDDKGTSVKPQVTRNTLRDLWKADAVVLGVIVRSGAVVFGIGPPYRGVRYFAAKTGGDVLDTGDAAEGLREMVQRQRTRYSLYYALPQSKPGEERTIEVKLNPDAVRRYPLAVVRVRSGYVSPGTHQ